MKDLLRLGKVYSTKKATEMVNKEDIVNALKIHRQKDWTDWSSDDKDLHFSSTKLLSKHRDRNGVDFLIVTWNDYSYTTISLPEEY